MKSVNIACPTCRSSWLFSYDEKTAPWAGFTGSDRTNWPSGRCPKGHAFIYARRSVTAEKAGLIVSAPAPEEGTAGAGTQR